MVLINNAQFFSMVQAPLPKKLFFLIKSFQINFKFEKRIKNGHNLEENLCISQDNTTLALFNLLYKVFIL